MERYMPWGIVNIMILTMFIISYYVNKTSNNGIFFGVRIPKEYQNESEIINLDNEYKKINIIVFLVIAVISNFLFAYTINLKDEVLATILVSIVMIILILHSAIFAIYYKKMKNLKSSKGWNRKVKNVVVVDTTLRKPKKNEKIKIINSKYFALLFIFPVVMTIITLFKYSSLPNIIEFPNSSFKNIEKDTLKGILALYQFPIAQFFMSSIFFFISKTIINSRVDLNSGSIKEAVERKKRFKRISSILMLVTGVEILILFSILQFSILYNFNSGIIEFIFSMIILVTMIVFIGLFVKVGQGGRNLESKEEIDELYKDDDEKWILGCLYYNKNDPAWMVEKRVGIGWTINLANPKGIIILVVLLIIIFFMVIIGGIIE